MQNQFKNGSIFKKTIDSSETKSATIILDSNNNFDSVNENRKTFQPPQPSLDDMKENLKQISEMRLNASNLSNTTMTSQQKLNDMPEWKRKLIEKKKQKIAQQN